MTAPDRSSDQTIARLARDLRPIRAASSPWLPTLGTTLGSGALITLAFAYWLRLRPDLSEKFAQGTFVLRDLGFGLAGVISILAVQRLSVPGRSSLHIQRALALLVPSVLAAGLAVFALIGDGRGTDTLQWSLAGSACTYSILVLSILPSSLLILHGRHHASTTPAWSGALIGLATSMLASAALGLHCPNDTSLHLLLWHLLLPASLSSLACAAIGSRLLRW